MSFDMVQHEKIRKCTKRAIERILFNYSLPANEIYEVVLSYQHDPKDLPTHDLKLEFEIPDVKNRYSKALMNIVAEFCIVPPQSLSLEQMAAAPKRYDEAYLKRRWKTQYEVFKAIFVDIPTPVERKKLFFSECILYSVLLATTHGRSISALNDRLETPSQKTRARKWLNSVAEALFSEQMKEQFRTVVSWYIEDELLKEAEDLGLSIIKRYLLPASKVVERKNNLYRSVNKAEKYGTDFPEERVKGATEEETMANIKMREDMKEERYLYVHAAHDILMLAELIANHTIANNISCDEWEEDAAWFIQRLMESPVYPQYRKEQLQYDLTAAQYEKIERERFVRNVVEAIALHDKNEVLSRKGVDIYGPYSTGSKGFMVPSYAEYEEACWLAEVINICVEAATKEACWLLQTVARTQVYDTETLYEYLTTLI